MVVTKWWHPVLKGDKQRCSNGRASLRLVAAFSLGLKGDKQDGVVKGDILIGRSLLKIERHMLRTKT